MKFLRLVLILCAVMSLTVSLPEKPRPAQTADTSLMQAGKASSPLVSTAIPPQTRARLSESFGQLPLSFEANQGQAADEVKYLSRGNGYQLQLKATEAVLQLRTAAGTVPETQSAIVRMKLVNANPAPQMAGRAELPGKSHYYIGNDPKRWRTNVANFAKVEYEQVWPGIDLVYYGNQRCLEYDFIVAPGADPQAIHFTFDGADKMKIDAQGNLVLRVAGGEVVMQKPFVYQEVSGARQQIAGSYQIRHLPSAIRNREVGFRVGDYDKNLPLVIDPVLVYSTYLGPASPDIANDIAVDQAGNVYITGGSYFSSEGLNAFVAKLNAAGTALVYSTAFIGGKDEIGFGVAVDAAGNAYATGYTRSTNFPVKNALQPKLGATDCRNVLGCSDAFVAKLDTAGTIVYSTYLGGNDVPGDQAAFGDEGHDIAVDASGQAYVTGSTVSKNFPVKNAFQPVGNADTRGNVFDSFITKFSASGTELVYSTYLGGTGIDDCYGIAIDAAGNAYVTGNTFGDQTNNFPTTPGSFQSVAPGGGRDAFVTKLNPTGNALVYSTFLGGNSSDQGEGIAVDSAGNAYVIGKTDSTSFPLEGAHQATNLGGSAFVTKLNPSGSALLYSSYLGKQVWIRTGNSPGAAIAVDTAGIAYVTGSTSAPDFPLVNPLFSTFGGVRDAYVAKINTVTKAVSYATFLGGSGTDNGFGIAIDSAGNAYVTGQTDSTNFPTKNPAQATPGGSGDVFVAKISDDAICPSVLRSGGSGLEESCLALRINAKADIFASDPVMVDVTAVKADGTIDTSFNGTVQVSLAADSTLKIGCLRSGGQCGTSQSLTLESGKLKQPLSLVTPLLQPAGTELTTSSVINLKDTVLEGKAVIKATAGNLSATSEVKVSSPLDLKVNRMEVQQGVKQNAADLWIGERDVMVRVYLDANRTGANNFDKYSQIQGITAKLTVRDKSGNEIIGSPFTLSKGGIHGSYLPGVGSFNAPDADYVFRPNAGPAADGSDSLNYLLPGTFDSQWSLEVKLDDALPDRDASNNTARYGPLNFANTRTQTFYYAKLRVLADNVKTEFPTQEGIDQEMEFIKQSWPVGPRALKFVEQPDITATENPVAGEPFSLLNRLLGVGFWLSSGRGLRYVYFVDRDYFPQIRGRDFVPLWGDRGTNGITNPILKMSIVDSNRCANIPIKCGVLAHELGHQLGMKDTYVLSGASQKDGNPVEAGNFTWFNHEFVGGTPVFGFPSTYLDFMGNGGDDADSVRTWVDLFTWNFLKPKLLFTSLQLQSPLEARNVTGSFVVAQGQVSKNGTASFGNCYTLTLTDPENTLTPGDYVLETVDANAAVLSSLNFAPDFRLPHAEQEVEKFGFNFALPFSSAVRQLRVRLGNTVLATRTVSANAPAVNFVSDLGGQTLTGTQQVTWTGADADGNALTYSLYYSPDGQLHLPLTETTATSYTWKTDGYLSGSAPRLTLVATDGINATVAESRTFTMPNRSPRITILSPGNLYQFKVGDPVVLTGSFFDPEEDLQLNPPLQWMSNLQGPLGSGKQIAVSNLQAGTHLITVSGADSQGARGTASITVVVRPDNFSQLAVTPGNIDFGTLAIGLARDITLRVQNTGTAPATVNSISSDNPQFRVLAPAAPVALAAHAQQDVILRFTPIAANAQSGTLTITCTATNQTSLSVALAGNAIGSAAGTATTVSAASYKGLELAAESIVAAFGSEMATSVAVASSVPLPTTLAGTTVRVRDSAGGERLAPLFFVAPQQVNYLIPPGTAAGAATVTITSGVGAVSVGAVTITPVAAGLFAANSDGQGPPAGYAIRVKADGAQVNEPITRFDPAQNKFVLTPLDLGPSGEQVFLVLFGTGFRAVSSLSAVSVKIGGDNAQVLYAGTQGGFVGLDQMNLLVPRSLIGRGEVELIVTINGTAANTLKLNLK